jgi:rhamnosyltransferase
MKPRVCVLLATLNGRLWIEAQVESVLRQSDVDVEILASDDGSTDGTTEWLEAKSISEPRLKLLPHAEPSGSSARNFERLIKLVALDQFGFLAFSDQDDVWSSNKLSCAVEHLAESGADGYSSNVTALKANGATQLIAKAQPQRRFDHYFESASSGSTFLLSRQLARTLQQYLLSEQFPTQEPHPLFAFHDWFIYCFARSAGFRWVIDERPFVLYRQHTRNEVGANIGLRAISTRMKKLHTGWYLDEVRRLCHTMESIAANSGAPILNFEDLRLQGTSKRLRFLWNIASEARRRRRDRWFLYAVVLLGIAR